MDYQGEKQRINMDFNAAGERGTPSSAIFWHRTSMWKALPPHESGCSINTWNSGDNAIYGSLFTPTLATMDGGLSVPWP